MSDLWLSETETPLKAALRNPSLAPLEDSLTGSPDEVAVKRMWENIEGKHESSPRRMVWGGAFAAAMAVCVLVFSFVWRVPAPLEMAQGGDVAPEFVAQGEPRIVPLNDGSHIRLHEQAELAMLNNEGGVFLTAVRSGKVEFHVKPGGKRRWVVDAGSLSVEVVGTVFTVERSESGASVSVTRGRVRVRGNVPGGEVILGAGDSVSAEPIAESVAQGEVSKPSRALSSMSGEEKTAEEDVFALSELPLEGESEEESENSDGEGPDDKKSTPSAARASLDSLMGRADAARKNGDWQKASQLLGRVVREASSADPRRGVAALSFARTSGDPVAIASALELGLPSMPGSLREPALARLLTAYQATGNQAQIRRVAHLYLIEFPQGPRSAFAKKLTNQP